MKSYLFGALLVIAGCATSDAKHELFEDWDNLKAKLDQAAYKSNQCNFDFKKKHVDSVEVDYESRKKFIMTSNSISCTASKLYFVTFTDYCHISSKDVLISASILKCDLDYRIFDFGVTIE